MPMFPDSGVPAADAKYSLSHVDKVLPCDELWYSTSRCEPRFDPAAANAMLAEDLNLINKGEVLYDCERLDHIERSVRYINQRGLPRGAFLTGTNDYVTTLDPPATRYNNFMTLSIVPATDNSGPSRLDAGKGFAPILRNDNSDIKARDMRAGIPVELVYYNGAWYIQGNVVPSQIPELRTGNVWGYVRTDGLDDPSHDGLYNTPASAFKTIVYAYETVGARYFPSPKLTLTIILGIPGRYAGANLGPYGGNLILQGDEANPAAYEIGPQMVGGITNACLEVHAARIFVQGVNLVADYPSGNWANLRIRAATNLWIRNTRMEARMNLNGGFITAETSGVLGIYGTNTFIGNGAAMNHAWAVAGGSIQGSNQIPNAVMSITNCAFTGAGVVSMDLGFSQWPAITIQQSGCTGPRYLVTDNSLIRASGQTLPGNAAGIISDHGLYFP